jgi:hypothetical protein
MMTLADLLILQIIAHILADFIFQSDLWTRHKKRYGFRSKIIYWHVLIVFIFSYLLSFQWNFILYSLLISFVHLVIDGLKVKLGNIKIGRVKPFQKFTFFADQSVHIGTICLAVSLFSHFNTINPVAQIPITSHYLLIILGYLVCLKPTNIVIREIFSIYSIKMNKQPTEDLLNAGKLIGNIERVLTLTLLLIGQYSAIGFIIAGKSILRYEGKKTSKTEYVLIGSLLSFGIAILIGVTIIKLKF